MFAPLLTGSCVDGDGRSAPCCMWQPSPWVLPAQVAVGLTLMWTMAARSQLRTYVLGGVVTQWCAPSFTRCMRMPGRRLAAPCSHMRLRDVAGHARNASTRLVEWRVRCSAPHRMYARRFREALLLRSCVRGALQVL